MMFYTGIVDIPLYIVSEASEEQLLAILGHKYYMSHQKIFVMPPVLIYVFHTKCLLIITRNYVTIFMVIL